MSLRFSLRVFMALTTLKVKQRVVGAKYVRLVSYLYLSYAKVNLIFHLCKKKSIFRNFYFSYLHIKKILFSFCNFAACK